MLDLTAPTPEQLDEAVAFVANQSECGVVYVHCKAGYSRTAAVAGAYLLSNGEAANVDETTAILRAARPGMIIRPEVIVALNIYVNRVGANVAPTPLLAHAGVPSPR